MPAQEARHHRHPNNPDAFIFGRKLGDGDTLAPDDVYSSTNYGWERCTCPGLTLQGGGGDPTWVRPEPCPPERELVRHGNLLIERKDLPQEPKDEEAPAEADAS